jgi:hypothetical protein
MGARQTRRHGKDMDRQEERQSDGKFKPKVVLVKKCNQAKAECIADFSIINSDIFKKVFPTLWDDYKAEHGLED